MFTNYEKIHDYSHFKIFIWIWHHNITLYEYISDRDYQPITVCIVNEHADITHSIEINPAPNSKLNTSLYSLIQVSQQLYDRV